MFLFPVAGAAAGSRPTYLEEERPVKGVGEGGVGLARTVLGLILIIIQLQK